MIADRIQRIGFSSTLRINAKTAQMRAEGIDVINLSVGEPDFPTPENIKNAAKAALDRNLTTYTATAGIPELRKAVTRKFSDEYSADYKPDNVIITTGAKQALYNCCLSLLNKGDEVIIPAPYWVSYPHMVSLAKGEPVIVKTKEENGFRLTPDELGRATSARTRAIILNNPSNPTGAAYSPEQLEKVINVCMDEGIIIIADEIYEKLMYDGLPFKSVCSFGAKARAHAVIINGFSKAYAMTGWRLGYAVAPVEIIEAMTKVQEHTTSNTNSITQWAGVEALLGPQHEISRMRVEFERRRNNVLYHLNSIPHCSCHKPEGAFYLFPNLSHYYDKQFEGVQIRNSAGLAYYLLKHAHVAVVPGEAFGADKFIRLSYANSMENLEKGMNRLIDALAELKPTVKAQRLSLINTNTKVTKSVEVDAAIQSSMRDAMVAEAGSIITYDSYHEWNASIGGVILRLATNSPHLIDFWTENWYPAALESDIEPHGSLFGVKDAPGREASAFYSPDTRTALFFNSAYYPQLRAIALGMVNDIASRAFDTFMLGGNCFDVNGRGVILIAPPGTGGSTHFAGLMRHPETRLHSIDATFVRWAGGSPIADSVERKFLIRTDIVKHLPEFTGLFDRSKLENVAVENDDSCPLGEGCPLKRGEPRCYVHREHSRALLDPYWIGSTAKHVKRTALAKVILLQRDNLAGKIISLKPDAALQRLEEGAYLSDKGGWRQMPFYNKYLLGRREDHVEHLRRQWKRLLDKVEFSVVNTAVMEPQEAKDTIWSISKG